MQMKKFVAATAREAMRKMKADMGAEAYVVSNRETAHGVEILAMAGNAIEHLTSAAQSGTLSHPVRTVPVTAAVAAISATAAAAPAAAPFKTLRDIAIKLPAAGVSGRAAPLRVDAAPALVPAAAPVAGLVPLSGPAVPPPAATAASANEQRLLDEFRSMKALLESRLADIAAQAPVTARPLASALWRELSVAGYSPAIARTLAGRLPDDYGTAQARQWMRDVLCRNLHCAGAADDLVSGGGVYALTGPTGVGKTTTVAKLAARCVVKHGAASLGLVTTDGYRIGAFDQLEIYGRILGVPVHAAETAADLEAVLAALRGKRLVLIDTVGMGQRDARLDAHMQLLDVHGVRRVLLLNAVAQAETLEDVVQAYRQISTEGSPRAHSAGAPRQPVILTKLDEAVRFGPALDVCMRHQLEIQYVTSGQRVPEDIHPAQAQALVHRSLDALAQGAFAIDNHEWLARESAHAPRAASALELH